VKRIYLRATSAIALVTFPMMAGMFVVSDSFVLGVLGPHWSEIIPVLKIFCLAGIASSIVTVTGSIYKSQGASALQFRVNLFTQPIKILGIIAGLPWGLQGVATGFTVALFFNSAITLTVAGKLLNLRLITLLRSLTPMLLAALLMAVLVSAIRPALNLQDELILFLIQAIAGSIIYWILVSTFGLKAYHDIAAVLRDEFLSRRSENKK
jgi:O-antigen/teichoic acid export membrane protein